MAAYNKAILIGNLVRDVNVRYTPKGTAVAEITLAINSSWYDKTTNTKKEETTFVDVTLWGRQAELAGEHLAKGSSVMIEGRLKLDSWEDKATGQKRSKLAVVAEEMQFLDSKGGAGGGNRSRPKPQDAPVPDHSDAFDTSDEVPF